MEFSPGEWTCLPAEDFELAVPRNPGTLGLEVMAQVRINGRVVDHVRTALGGSEILRVNFNTRDIFLAANLPATPLQLEMWPRDISVRRNMASSEWIDVNALIASNTILVTAGEAAGSAAPPNNADLVAALNKVDTQPAFPGLSESETAEPWSFSSSPFQPLQPCCLASLP